MKRSLGILLLMGGLAISAQAQRINGAKVPTSVKAAFQNAHPAVTVTWEMEQANYEAGFFLNGKENSEVYTPGGALIETENTIKSSELPATVLARLKGKKIAEAAKITKADNTIWYEVEVKGKDLLFDANGNTVKN